MTNEQDSVMFNSYGGPIENEKDAINCFPLMTILMGNITAITTRPM